MSSSAKVSEGKVFNYTNLDAVTSQFVQQQTGEIRALMKRTAQDIIEIGRKLKAIKTHLGHGQFLDWLDLEFAWSWDTANRFMRVAEVFGKNQQFADLNLAPSALYVLAAPSTPDSARQEALSRAESGESISYTTAKAIKQKHRPIAARSATAAPAVTGRSTPTVQPRPQLEIVAIRPASLTQITSGSKPATFQTQSDRRTVGATSTLQLSTSTSPHAVQPGTWWKLGTRHLLYCGDPNSPEFIRQIPTTAQLLLAFPSDRQWQPAVQLPTYLTATRFLPTGKTSQLFEDTLESILLLYSDLGETVVNCFLPTPDILSIVNRLDRRGLFAEPNLQQIHTILTDWKSSGLKAERLNLC